MCFTNKVVIVTGAANGIGQVIASQYALKGAKVVIADKNEQKGLLVEERIKKSGGICMFVNTDVRNENEVIQLFEKTVDVFGSLHILINNAGKGGSFKSPFELSLEEWDDIINTNLRSVFIAAKEAAKYMCQNKNGGTIINISSTRAYMSEPNSEPYAASKGGIVAITHALAASFSKYKIKVNSISPGGLKQEITQN